MNSISRTALLTIAFAVSLAVAPAPCLAQQTAEDAEAMAEMRALQSELREGKRAFVEQQLVLTPEQAAKFWPVYDAHQDALSKLNTRRMENILAYARVWNAGAISDADADALGMAALQIEKDEAALLERTYKKLNKVIPGAQRVRYLQLEAKLRAIIRFEQAAKVPLAE